MTTPDPDTHESGEEPLIDRLRRATAGRFEISTELGSGGMATVFRAREVALDRQVAIKVMSPAIANTPGAIERFRREARVAAALSHPHIVPIHAIGEEPRLAYYVMKFIEGRSLDALLRDEGAQSVSFVQATLSVVGGALHYAHQRGVVHRDVKPANIMLDREGWTYVTDFGIAKQDDGQGLTQSGTIIGTPAYMCPEQFNGAKVTGAADQYSLGIVAFELLAGHTPFGGPSLGEVMRGHLLDPVPPLRTVRPDVPEAIESCVTRMLAKEPVDRFPSIADAVAAFGAAAATAGSNDAQESRAAATVPSGRIGNTVARVAPTTPMPRPPASPPPASPPPASPPPAPRTPTPRRRALPARRGLRRVIYAGLTIGLVGLVMIRAPGSRVSTPRPAGASESTTTASPAAAAPAPRPSAPPGSPARSAPAGPTIDAPSRATVSPSPTPAPATAPSADTVSDRTARGRAARQRLEQINDRLAASGKKPIEGALVRIGTRAPMASLFVNDRLRGVIGGRGVQSVPVSPGTVRLSIRLRGCVSWDTTFTAENESRHVIGERAPRC